MNNKSADNEIIKELETIRYYIEEAGVVLKDPYINELKLRHSLLIDALDLINRQKAEIEKLNIELKAMRGTANSYKTEVEKLENALLEEMYDKTDMGKRAVSLIDGHIEEEQMPDEYNFEVGV